MLEPLTVAAAQPACRPGDVGANAVEHAAVVRRARARVVAFPELSLTGYDLTAPALPPEDPALGPLLEACSETGTIALAGAVTEEAGRRHIATLAVGPGGVGEAYRKTWLGGDEASHVSPGDGARVLTVDGWRLGLAICKDTGSARHTAALAALGVDVYVAGVVHRPDELAEQEARATVAARTCRAYTIFASAAGHVGEDYPETCGVSGVWSPDGLAVARAGREPDEIVRATLV